MKKIDEEEIQHKIKKAGRIKMTVDEENEHYQQYIERIKNRNKPDTPTEKLIKILSRDEWNVSRPSGETSHEIFIRLAKTRMPKIIKNFKNIEALAKYAHTPEQGEKIIADLQKKIDNLKVVFSQKQEKTEIEEYEI